MRIKLRVPSIVFEVLKVTFGDVAMSDTRVYDCNKHLLVCKV